MCSRSVIENRLHSIIDVVLFRDDRCRLRKGHGCREHGRGRTLPPQPRALRRRHQIHQALPQAHRVGAPTTSIYSSRVALHQPPLTRIRNPVKKRGFGHLPRGAPVVSAASAASGGGRDDAAAAAVREPGNTRRWRVLPLLCCPPELHAPNFAGRRPSPRRVVSPAFRGASPFDGGEALARPAGATGADRGDGSLTPRAAPT